MRMPEVNAYGDEGAIESGSTLRTQLDDALAHGSNLRPHLDVRHQYDHAMQEQHQQMQWQHQYEQWRMGCVCVPRREGRICFLASN